MLQIKKGKQELASLEGEEMVCALPSGVLISPESNLKDCSGKLKENIQDIVISRMHTQIVENLDQINQTLTKVI
jgi:hypothetical protein